MSDPWLQLRVASEALGLAPAPTFEAQARAYLDELGHWSRVARLTGHRSQAERIRHLVLDSLLFLAVIPEPASPLLDIGSGAGAPGLLLKLARPGWAVTLVESSRRRANFLRQVARRLNLEDLAVREARAEALAGEEGMAGAFRTVTLRAVIGPGGAERLAAPFAGPGGHTVISLAPGVAPPGGTVRRVSLVRLDVGLRIERAFLIIPAAVDGADVPRGTKEARGPDLQRSQPKRGSREDDHGGEPGRGPGRCRAPDTPG